MAQQEAMRLQHAPLVGLAQVLVAEMAQQEAMRLRFALLMPEPECASLAGAIAAAQQAIERADALPKERDRFAYELRTESTLLAQAVEERNAAQAALDRWREEWRQCLGALKRPDNEPRSASSGRSS
jgi:hypothetical protein